MDPVRNPFAPGAGSPPPALAGRDDIVENARVSLQRILVQKYAKSQILLGLRGTGKTVLLNKIEQMAEEFGHLTSFIEAPEGRSLAQQLYPKIHQVLRKLSLVERAKEQAYHAMRALRNFAGTFKINVGDMAIAVEPEIGIADSGILEFDLSELIVRVGEAAKSAGKSWTLLIDELQYLSESELAALITAIHRSNQKQLPFIMFGAGLPQIAALSGDAKSYSERLFNFIHTGPLGSDAVKLAIGLPVESEGETITTEAIAKIRQETKGYPYFLQEWGYQAWNAAENSPIGIEVIEEASAAAVKRLDDSFFRVRYDRLTPKEREYVSAMASLGEGPYRSSDVAEKLNESVRALGPCRAGIIKKGMIYSPAHGDIAFTVPLFEEFVVRNQ